MRSASGWNGRGAGYSGSLPGPRRQVRPMTDGQHPDPCSNVGRLGRSRQGLTAGCARWPSCPVDPAPFSSSDGYPDIAFAFLGVH